MEIILLERVEKLGQIGDLVKVKTGYARNYLLPQKKALRATKQNIADFEQRKFQIEADNLKLRSEAENIATKMEKIKVVLLRAASETGHLYGSVTSRNIAEYIVEQGFNIQYQQVEVTKPIKLLGIHDVDIRLHPEIKVSLSVNIARSLEEAKQQQKRVDQGLPAFISDVENIRQEGIEESKKAKQAKVSRSNQDQDENVEPRTDEDDQPIDAKQERVE
ncbi:MAG: 50S ribosomal protein L9 [Pseudomonadota bacterium]